ncbi:phage integrase [Bacterioplanoides sp.]|uniref:phage integrase n=1 Tax=Bacterioplanoides sp. TaxID=2066072 RepID=UPI003AFF80AA
MAKKTEKGWLVDMRPDGRNGRRIRRTFPSKAEALRFEAHTKSQADKGEWNPKPDDNRRLSELCQLWFKYHGNTLASGEKRLQQLLATSRDMNDPIARLISPKDWLKYRDQRLDGGTSKNHLNHELTYLKAVFNTLSDMDEWNGSKPLEKVKKLTLKKRHPFFLSLEQVVELQTELANSKNPDALTIANICLSTGCRWGEAQYLDAENIHNGKVHFQETKNELARSVPIDDELTKEILSGRPERGPLFQSAWEAFESAIDRTSIELPKGTMTHVLRHTYASHFMIDGGDLLELNKILGHLTIQMTMTYAHLAPDHLGNAPRHSPLARLRRLKQSGQNVDTGKS